MFNANLNESLNVIVNEAFNARDLDVEETSLRSQHFVNMWLTRPFGGCGCLRQIRSLAHCAIEAI